jgi:hypothetical protein
MSWLDIQRGVSGSKQTVRSNQMPWRNSPLAGSVYAMTNRKGTRKLVSCIGNCSLHFPTDSSSSVPVIDLSNLSRESNVPIPRALFLSQAYFDKPSRTFYGKVVDNSTDSYIYISGQACVLVTCSASGSEWLILMTFSHDYSFVRRSTAFRSLFDPFQARVHSPIPSGWRLGGPSRPRC